MAYKQRKEVKYLNASIDKELHDEFNLFCKEMGQTKTAATEKALRMYMDKMRQMLNM